MSDEYIRLDTTIMGLDGLINEAPTGSQARALICAKDMIYDQQRYVSEMKPVKHGKWNIKDNHFHSNIIMNYAECSCCGHTCSTTESTHNNYCPNCGADMRSE